MATNLDADLDTVCHHLRQAFRHLEQAVDLLGCQGPTPPEPPAAVITDREPRPLPALPDTAAGEITIDPTFGSRILRVTSAYSIEANPPAIVSYRSSDSTIQRAWNSTVSRFTVENTYGEQLVFAFEPGPLRARFLRAVRFDRRRESPSVPPATVVPFNGSDAAWHNQHPDRLYGRSGNKIIKVFDFATEQMSTVIDLDTLGLNLPAESYTSGVCVMADTLLTTCGGAVNDDNHIVVVGPLTGPPSWRTLDTLLETDFNAGRGFLLHSTTLDLTGRYVLMVPSQKSGVPGGHLFTWDLETNLITEITVAVSGHCALGRGVYVNQDCKPDTPWDAAQWTKRAFFTPNSVENCITPVLQPKEIYLAEHPSWTNMREMSDPFVSATYRHQPSDVPWRAWDEEIITINPTSGEVRRQAHHRSQVLTPAGVWDYWATPRPNISPDGRFALFTSNWGRTLGTDAVEGGDRQDAFIVELR